MTWDFAVNRGAIIWSEWYVYVVILECCDQCRPHNMVWRKTDPTWVRLPSPSASRAWKSNSAFFIASSLVFFNCQDCPQNDILSWKYSKSGEQTIVLFVIGTAIIAIMRPDYRSWSQTKLTFSENKNFNNAKNLISSL